MVVAKKLDEIKLVAFFKKNTDFFPTEHRFGKIQKRKVMMVMETTRKKNGQYFQKRTSGGCLFSFAKF